MISFKQYITEASRGFVKGWVHKSGKIMDTTMYTRYHIMQVVINLRKFGLNKNKMLKIIRDAYPDAPEEFAEKHLDSLQTGKVDNDTHIEEYLQKRGWCMFVIDKTHGSISGWDEKSTKQAAKALDAKHLPYETRKGLKLFEVKLVRGRPKYITSKYDWYNWLEGKKAAGKRTEIGSTMAMFREAILMNEISPQIAARLAGARESQGKGFKRQSKKAWKGALKRRDAELDKFPSDHPAVEIEKNVVDKQMAKAKELGLKSGRVTSKNLGNTRWGMQDRPERILSHKFGTTY